VISPSQGLYLNTGQHKHRINTFFLFPLALQPTFGPWPTFMKPSVSLRFSRSWTIGMTPWAGDQLVARLLLVYKHQTSMPWVEFEPTIPGSERAKTVHALDRSATVTGQNKHTHTPKIHALSGIRKRDPSVRASEDNSCLTPPGYCDRLIKIYNTCKLNFLLLSRLWGWPTRGRNIKDTVYNLIFCLICCSNNEYKCNSEDVT
jgi:hypothetical protein